MTDSCRNCGKDSGHAIRHDWDAQCVHCGQLLWLRPGDIAECKVERLTQFGIFVELGDGLEGLIHISELTERRIRHPEEVVGVGRQIRAKVHSVDVSEKRISLSCRLLP